MVPGPGDETVDATGHILDRDKFIKLLKEYYELRGWEKDTGLPEEKALFHLGVEELLPDFHPLLNPPPQGGGQDGGEK